MNRNTNTMARVTGTLLDETAKAYLIRDNSQEETEAWVPKSMCDYTRKDPFDGTIVVEVPTWLAEEKALDFEEVD